MEWFDISEHSLFGVVKNNLKKENPGFGREQGRGSSSELEKRMSQNFHLGHPFSTAEK